MWGWTIFGKRSQSEAEFHLFIFGLGECGEKEIELTHTKTTDTFL